MQRKGMPRASARGLSNKAAEGLDKKFFNMQDTRTPRPKPLNLLEQDRRGSRQDFFKKSMQGKTPRSNMQRKGLPRASARGLSDKSAEGLDKKLFNMQNSQTPRPEPLNLQAEGLDKKFFNMQNARTPRPEPLKILP